MAEDKEKLTPKERCIRLFHLWKDKTNEEFRQYVHRGQLNRRDIAMECSVSTSVLTQNLVIRGEIEELEARLRADGVLPILVEGTKGDPTQAKHPEEDRLRRLEAENAMLRAEVEKYKKFTQRYRLMEKFMSETGRMPR